MRTKTKLADPESLIRSGKASRMAGISVQHLHQLARSGKVDSVVIDGFRLFSRQDVERLAAERSTAQ